MGIRESITKSLLRATSDKTDLNKKALRWQKAFAEVDQKLNGPKKK